MRKTGDGMCCVQLEMEYDAYIWRWNMVCTIQLSPKLKKPVFKPGFHEWGYAVL